jgi:tRNA pseudouridine38-40 synthase
MLCGEHDFRNFSRDRKLPAVRGVLSSNVRISGNFVIIEVEADSFVWNMMRKLVTALILVGSGQRTVEWFADMLNPQRHREGLRSAPAFGLVLTKVEYPDIHFVEDAYAKKRALRCIRDLFMRNSTMTEVLKTFDKQMTSNPKLRRLELI